MEEVIVAVCPYRIEILKGCIHARTVQMANIVLVGDRAKIVEVAFVANLSLDQAEIVHCEYDLDVCFAVNDLLAKRKVVGLVLGAFNGQFLKNIAEIDCEVNVIDVPFSHHLLFVANYLKDSYVSFDEKAKALGQAKKMMKDLNIAYYNIGLVAGQKSKVNEIECSVLKMDESLKPCDIDVVDVFQVFDRKHNLLVFNDINSSNIFMDALLTHKESKYANIKLASNAYIVDASKMKLKDVFFSLFLINKMSLNAEAS